MKTSGSCCGIASGRFPPIRAPGWRSWAASWNSWPADWMPTAAERMELESIVTAVEHLPPRTAPPVPRNCSSDIAKSKSPAGGWRRCWKAATRCGRAFERAIVEYNGRRGRPASFDLLEAFVTDQPYRLCHWRVATDEINYRRFFDVDSLAAIRVEDPEVFQAVHEPTFRLIERGWVTALRIDHADGLHDPAQYLTNLAEAVRQAMARARRPSRPTRQSAGCTPIVEKILGSDESLPADWPVQGTTGYDFLNLLNGVFVDRLGG